MINHTGPKILPGSPETLPKATEAGHPPELTLDIELGGKRVGSSDSSTNACRKYCKSGIDKVIEDPWGRSLEARTKRKKACSRASKPATQTTANRLAWFLPKLWPA